VVTEHPRTLDRQLVHQCLSGDAVAERALYDAHVERVYRLMHRMAGDPDLAADFTQDTFIRAFERPDQYRGDASLGAWLHTIAVSVALNGMRKVRRIRGRTENIDESPEMSVQPKGGFTWDLKVRLHSAVDALSEKLRAIGRAGGEVVSIRTWIGGPTHAVAPETSIGDVPPAEAAHYLLSLARAGSGSSAERAIAAAAMADGGNIAPDLTALVRDDNAGMDSRKQALFRLGQSDDESSRELAALADALKPFALREQFVFVLSQRRDDASLDKLMDVAQHDPDRDIRKRSMCWLGQSREPRAVKFLRDIITR
jgi:RNA polymerase sigma factor (sigma-70 family)